MDLSYKQVEAVFLKRFGVEPAREGAFRARLQNIQRRKILRSDCF